LGEKNTALENFSKKKKSNQKNENEIYQEKFLQMVK
jgi:hypothetical protein